MEMGALQRINIEGSQWSVYTRGWAKGQCFRNNTEKSNPYKPRVWPRTGEPSYCGGSHYTSHHFKKGSALNTRGRVGGRDCSWIVVLDQVKRKTL